MPPYHSHWFVDITGQRFGRWTVLRMADDCDSQGDHLWVCRCECGTERNLRGGALRAGKTSGCRSCHVRDMHRAGKIKRPVPNKHRKK